MIGTPPTSEHGLGRRPLPYRQAQSTFEPLCAPDLSALPIPPVHRVLPSQEAPALEEMEKRITDRLSRVISK